MRCATCAAYLHDGTNTSVLNGKRYCGDETSQCVYVARKQSMWRFTPAEAGELINQLFDEIEGAA